METTVLSGAGARKDVHALLDRIIDRGKPVTYNRVKALVSRIFKHGIDVRRQIDVDHVRC